MRLPFWIRRYSPPALRWIPVRIKAGPNQGCRWSLAASGRYVRGRFEVARVEAIRALVGEGNCVWDGGAHHGYVTLAVSRLIGSRGRVYAFEPSSYNLPLLRNHVRWNGLSNAEVVPVALGGEDSLAHFGGRGSSEAFSVGEGKEVVRVLSVSTLVANGFRTPDFMKLDIEDAEGEVLEACASQLSPTAVAMVSVHSRISYHRAVAALTGRGFQILESPALRRLREREDWGIDDPAFLALGPDRRHLLDRARRLPYFSV